MFIIIHKIYNFEVEIKETFVKKFCIEAHSEKEARQIATRMYDDEEVVLDLDFCDHVQTNMTVKRIKSSKTKDEIEENYSV